MTSALTKVHSIIIRTANVVAKRIVANLNKQYSRSNSKALRAIALREDVIFSTKIVIEAEKLKRVNLNKQLIAANRLLNV